MPESQHIKRVKQLLKQGEGIRLEHKAVINQLQNKIQRADTEIDTIV